jgi:plastocyanin
MKHLPILAFCLVCALISIFSLGCPYAGPQYPVQYGNATPTPTPAPSSASVTISGSAYSPAAVTILHGGTVVWQNNDPYGHTVDPSNGTGCAADNPVAAGSSITLTFPTATTIYYHCTIHAPSCNGFCSVTCTGPMTGTVVVQ